MSSAYEFNTHSQPDLPCLSPMPPPMPPYLTFRQSTSHPVPATYHRQSTATQPRLSPPLIWSPPPSASPLPLSTTTAIDGATSTDVPTAPPPQPRHLRGRGPPLYDSQYEGGSRLREYLPSRSLLRPLHRRPPLPSQHMHTHAAPRVSDTPAAPRCRKRLLIRSH